MAATRQDTINDALDRVSELGFTMEHSFSEHGPMVAEAISTLGCNDAVAGWVEICKSKHRHSPLPPHKEPIRAGEEAELRCALGDYARATDWLDFFRRQLNENRWQDVVAD
jgi:hypothetical protein